MRAVFTPADRRFLAVISVVLILATAVPYMLAWQAIPTGRVYSGVHFQNTGDWNVYYNVIEQVRQGRVTVANGFSTIDDRPVILMPVFLVAGLLARLTTLPTPLVFQLMRLALLPLLIFVLAKACHRYATPGAWHWSLLVFLFAGGFGAAAELLDVVPFLSLFFSPHYVLGWVLWCWILLLLPDVRRGQGSSILFLAAAESLLLLTIPFAGVLGLALIGLGLTFLPLIPDGRPPAWRPLLGVALLLMPVVAYQTVLMFSTGVQSYLHQNVTATPSPLALAAGSGGVLAFALIGVRQWRQQPRLLLVLGAIGLLLSWLPLPFQQRFLFSVPLPLALLAGGGLATFDRVLARLPRLHPTASMVITGIIAFTVLSSAALTMTVKTIMVSPQLAMSQDEAAVVWWVRASTPLSVHILSQYRLGNLIAGQTGRTVWLGHGIQTPAAGNKSTLVTALEAGRVAAPEIVDLLRTDRVAVLVLSAATVLPALDGLAVTRAFTTPSLTVYTVQ